MKSCRSTHYQALTWRIAPVDAKDSVVDAADVTLLDPVTTSRFPARRKTINEDANRNVTCAGGRGDDAILPSLVDAS